MQKLSIYIPMELPQAVDYVRLTLIGLSDITGGASSTLVNGAWMSQFHVLIQEPVTVVYTLATEKQAETAKLWLQKVAREIRTALNQEAVLITVEDVKEAIFVS